MTKKDYILISAALEAAKAPVPNLYDSAIAACALVEMHAQIAGNLARALAADNPRFDRDHFLAVVRGERALNSRP